MATATITETLELPSGAVTDLTAARVRLRLVADSDGAPAPGYVTGDNATVVADKWTNPNSSGTYTFTAVRPNSGSSSDVITSPTGSVYQIAIFLRGQSAVHRYISVPDSAGPHEVADILTIAPDPLPTGQDLLDLIDAAGLDLTDLPAGVTADGVVGLDGGALVELTPAQVMATHTGDTSDAHDAAAISYAGGTGMSATDVEAAIDELATEKANTSDLTDHTGDTTAAHAASAISYAGGTGMSATDVEAAIDELATEKADLTGAAFTGDVTVTGAAGGRVHIDVDASTDIAGVSLLGSGDTQPRAALTFSAFDVPALVMGPGGSSVVDTTLYRSAAGVVNANGGGFAGVGKGVVFTEQTAPSSPAANDIVLYAADDGGGTTVLRTKDSAGTVTTLGSGGGGLTAEDVRDTIGTALVEGEAIDITVNDGADTITIAAEDASDTNKGVVELATTAETQTGTDATRAVTPAGGAATYQPLDSDLTAIAGLTSAADRLPYFTGSGTASLATFTAAGRALVDDADAAAQRTTLGLGSLATASAITSSDITDGTIVNADINASAAIAGTKVDAATDTVRGTVELATATEVLTGTDTGRAPTPSVLAPFAAHTRVSGALAETVPRHLPASAITLTSGRLHLVAISLPAGLTITSITFVSGAGLSGLSNQWFGLFDSSRVPLRLTGDDTSTAWALNTAKTLNLSSTYATTTAGLYYLGICVVASGMGTIAAQASTAIMTGFAPIISGSSSTGLTNPASCPNPAGALGATSTIPFAYVS